MRVNTNGLSGILGFVIGLILCIVIFRFFNSNKKAKTEYDERQELVRGRGYKYGFYTALIYLVVAIFPPVLGFDLYKNGPIICIGGICLSVLVLCIYNLWHDSYWGLNNDRKKYIILIIVIALFNGFVAVRAILNGDFIQDGVIKGAGANLICSVTFVILLIAILIKSVISKKEDDING